VLVDDRSDDGTAEAAKSSADGVNLEVVRVDEVPPGWAPKPNAIMTGALRASYGSALLFLDADVFGDLGPLVSAASGSRLASWRPLSLYLSARPHCVRLSSPSSQRSSTASTASTGPLMRTTGTP